MTLPFGTVVELTMEQAVCRFAADRTDVTVEQFPLSCVSTGTVTNGGPDDTVTVMTEPSDTWPVGLQVMTVPWGTVVELMSLQLALRWTAASIEVIAGQSPLT